jgi:O-antigen/teichoic acid export membrane protein
MGNAARADQIGLIGIGVLLALISTSQIALLQGLRRIRDLGLVTVLGAVAGTAAGLLAVWMQGQDGLIWFVLVQPLTAALVALYFTNKIPRPTTLRFSVHRIWSIWRPMVILGGVFMLGGLATMATLLLVRAKIVQDLDLEAAGYFAASWGITMQYVGFLLGAMAADYYPRLTEIIQQRDKANTLINDQMQIGLALGGPILLILIGLAPWVVSLLYSSEFSPATELLQWQSVGNVFKLASWPLGFAFVAAGRSGLFLGTGLFWNAMFLGLIWGGLPVLGLKIAGIGFMLAYVLHFFVLNILVCRLQGFVWQRLSGMLIVVHGGLAMALLLLARTAPVLGAVAGVGFACLTGLAGVRMVLIKVGPGGRLASTLARGFARIGWPLKHSHED